MAKLIACGPLSRETEDALMFRSQNSVVQDFVRTNALAVELQDRNRLLSAHVAALEKDANRYRWLRKRLSVIDCGGYLELGFEAVTDIDEDIERTPDALIDAAMQDAPTSNKSLDQ